jgi:hypothetical protein
MLALPGFLFLAATAYSAPLILLVLLARKRINPRVGSGLISASFAISTGYMLWRIEWFDVWRHGVPSLDYLAVYAVWMAVMAAAGWCIGLLLQRRSGAARTSV